MAQPLALPYNGAPGLPLFRESAKPLREVRMLASTTTVIRDLRLPPPTIRLAVAALLAAIVLGLLACSPPDPVRIGFLGGLSGRVADLGIGGRNGAILAVEMRNLQGGINGRPIELIAEDDQQDAAVAKQAIARLLARKVEAVIGPMTSVIALVVLPQINEAGIPLISPTVTTNALTAVDDHFFRVVAPTAAHVSKSAEYHFHEGGLRRVVLVCDLTNKAYSESWATDFRNAFTRLGGQVIGEVGFDSGESLSALATSVLADKPDGVLIIANSVDTALLVQQLRMRDLAVHIGTAEWAATERLIELGGRAVEGVVVAQYIDREKTTPAYLTFLRAYRKRFNHEPGFAGLTAFDATNVALDALATRSSDQTLKQALLARATYVGAQSAIELNASGDTQRGTFLSVIRNGEFKSLH